VNHFLNVALRLDAIPLLFALLLGIVGALAPCQITGNVSAMMVYGNRSVQKPIVWKEAVAFLLGKVVAFSFLGFIVWLLGNAISYIADNPINKRQIVFSTFSKDIYLTNDNGNDWEQIVSKGIGNSGDQE
jgi:hypothetical protein